MIPDDAEAGEQPRRRARRRRRAKDDDQAAPAGRSAARESEAEAAAFLDPPPVGDEGGARGDGSPRKRRARRRRGGSRDASARDAAPAEAPDVEATSADGSDGSDGSDGDRESADGERGARRGRRKRGARRKRSGTRSRREEARPEAADGAIPPLPEDDEDLPPLPGDGQDTAAGSEDEGSGKGRRRRRRGRRARGEGEGGDAERAAKDDREPRGGREKQDKRGRGEKRERKRSDRSDRSERRDRRSGRRDHRGEGRRGDPRAIDIVPRAPSKEERAKEKILLVNARDREEARIALLVDGRLEEIYIETASSERSSAGNIYRGRVQNVERGIGAAFVDLGRGLTGFLHASDLASTSEDDRKATVTERLQPGDEVIVQITRDSIGRKGPALTGRISFPGRYLVLMPFTARSGISRRIPQGSERDRVRKLLRKLAVPEGMGVIVRTASETTDLAALQADLDHLLREWEFIHRKAAEPGQPGMLRGESDLAERSVRDIMPGDVSRIIVDKDDIAGRIHRLLRVWYPSAAAAAEEAAHVHARAAAAERDTPRGELTTFEEAPVAEAEPEPTAEPEAESLLEDEDVDVDEEPRDDGSDWDEASSGEMRGDGDLDDVEELEEDEDDEDDEDADDDERAAEAGDEAVPEESSEERMARLQHLAQAMPEVELHTEDIPLFHKFGAETQLEDAFRRSTRLPSGGSIVIDPTEALVAVDVNSGRLTDEIDPESTALVTNLEAVEEAARQLRLRDLGGLVVIDFIDMREAKSRRKVELALRDSLSRDRARIRMGRMGPFGLVVLSRQRIRQALSRVTHDVCVTCAGTGRRRQISGLGLRVLREMQARIARSRGRGGLEVRAPAEVVTWIRKNRSQALKQLTKSCSGPITLEADARLAVDGWAMKGLPPA